MHQIETLRKQLDKSDLTTHGTGMNAPSGRLSRALPPNPAVQSTTRNSTDRDMRAFLDTISQRVSRFNPNNLFESNSRPIVQHPPSDPLLNLGIILDSLPTSTPPVEANPVYLHQNPGYPMALDTTARDFLDRVAQNSVVANAPGSSTRFYHSQGVESYQVPSEYVKGGPFHGSQGGGFL